MKIKYLQKTLKKNLVENIQVYNKYFKKNKKYILNFIILKNYIKIHLKKLFIYFYQKMKFSVILCTYNGAKFLENSKQYLKSNLQKV